jgi:hypothetical protein
MSTPTPTRAAGHGDEQGDGHEAGGRAVPLADCRADATGALTFVLTTTARHGAPPRSLLLRRRGTDPADEVLLPLTPGGDGRPVAVLDRGAELAEGRWDAYLHQVQDAPRRLTPGVNDLRALLSHVPDHRDGSVAARIPYGTRDGFLAVRSWWRAPHAEAGELHVGPEALTVHGAVYGAELTGRACLELRRRAAPYPVLHAGATARGSAFSGTVAYRALVAAAAGGIWDLWLCPRGEGGPRVRIARLLDDIADKKQVLTFPTRRLAAGAPIGEEAVDIHPYYTLDNDLAVHVGAARAS